MTAADDDADADAGSVPSSFKSSRTITWITSPIFADTAPALERTDLGVCRRGAGARVRFVQVDLHVDEIANLFPGLSASILSVTSALPKAWPWNSSGP